MKKDISIPEVKNVWLAVTLEADGWRAYLVNGQTVALHTIMITSKGYGHKQGNSQQTSVLRHMIPRLEPGDYALIESIDPSVLHLSNEYWVSYYLDRQLYDKKYIFLPDSIKEENMIYIKELDQKGVLHR